MMTYFIPHMTSWHLFERLCVTEDRPILVVTLFRREAKRITCHLECAYVAQCCPVIASASAGAAAAAAVTISDTSSTSTVTNFAIDVDAAAVAASSVCCCWLLS
jgi:hypothetical protein